MVRDRKGVRKYPHDTEKGVRSRPQKSEPTCHPCDPLYFPCLQVRGGTFKTNHSLGYLLVTRSHRDLTVSKKVVLGEATDTQSLPTFGNLPLIPESFLISPPLRTQSPIYYVSKNYLGFSIIQCPLVYKFQSG